MPAAKDERPVKELSSNRSHPSLSEGIGLRGSDRGEDHPASSVLNTSSKERLNLEPRSLTRKRIFAVASSRSKTRFLACWVTKAPSGFVVAHVTCTFRVSI